MRFQRPMKRAEKHVRANLCRGIAICGLTSDLRTPASLAPAMESCSAPPRGLTQLMGIDTEAFLNIARGILSQPTAPFHEDAVRAEIARQLSGCKSVSLEEDRFGNLIARYQRGTKAPALAFAAHMDHPA